MPGCSKKPSFLYPVTNPQLCPRKTYLMHLFSTSIEPAFLLVAGILALLAIAAVLLKKLTVSAACGAWLLGIVVAMGTELTGLLLLAAFFILGTAATAYGKKRKAALQQNQQHPQTRSLNQVLANGGVAGLAAFASMAYFEQAPLYQLILAASLASATADTLSSELGMVHGKNFYNILSFKKEPVGLDGVVSLEGTLFGLAGTIIIALIFALMQGFDRQFAWIIIAGNAGNIADSLLGATLQRKKYLSNDAVNLFNTLFAALVAFLLSHVQ